MKNCFLIVNYNDYKSTKHLVDNIIDYEIIDEIVIVDNGSRDKEIELIKTITNKKIHLIFNEENNGYSNAINIGSKYLIDKYEKCNLIISNSDIVIMSEEDLVQMIEYLNYESIGVVGPQILERGSISRGWKNPSPVLDFFENIPGLNYFISDNKKYYNDEYYEGETSIVDVLSTCFFLISSDTLQKINYMDENVFLYYEDNILSKKVRDLELLVVICNKVKIKHLYSISVDKNVKKVDKMKMLYSSQIYYHSTYNNANEFERFLLKVSSKCRLFFNNIIDKFKK